MVLDLLDRVELETDPAAQATWVTVRHSARIPATVVIETPGGTVEQSRRHARGGADEPLTDGEVERKFRELAEPVVGALAAARIEECVAKLETIDGVAPLTAALVPEGGRF
jgi:2-methylcitrate dehydratase PrpD